MSRRVTKYRFVAAGRRIEISLRRFRTAKNRRSQRQKQFVLSLRHLPVKEVAISWQRVRRAKRQLVMRPGAVTLMALGLIGGSYSGLHLKSYPRLEPVASHINAVQPTQAVPQPKVLAASQPERIAIPAINLDTSVVPVGLKSDGSITVPSDPWVTGWYDQGPTPGERGSAVIVGHVDQPSNIAIFWNLRKLQPGDTITISRSDGSTATFKISNLQEYSQANFPTQAVYGPVNYAGLRLVTCGGTFDEITHQYSENMVVYASLVS